MKSDKRTFDENTLLLYGITDRTWLCGRSLEEDVRKSLEGGVTFLQIREKHLDDGEFLEDGKPDQIFDNPQHPRLKDFLDKVLNV